MTDEKTNPYTLKEAQRVVKGEPTKWHGLFTEHELNTLNEAYKKAGEDIHWEFIEK